MNTLQRSAFPLALSAFVVSAMLASPQQSPQQVSGPALPPASSGEDECTGAQALSGLPYWYVDAATTSVLEINNPFGHPRTVALTAMVRGVERVELGSVELRPETTERLWLGSWLRELDVLPAEPVNFAAAIRGGPASAPDRCGARSSSRGRRRASGLGSGSSVATRACPRRR